jgi:hypothetical protein
MLRSIRATRATSSRRSLESLQLIVIAARPSRSFCLQPVPPAEDRLKAATPTRAALRDL